MVSSEAYDNKMKSEITNHNFMQNQQLSKPKILIIIGPCSLVDLASVLRARIQTCLKSSGINNLNVELIDLETPNSKDKWAGISVSPCDEMDPSNPFDFILCFNALHKHQTLEFFNLTDGLLNHSGQVHFLNCFSTEELLNLNSKVTPLNNIKRLALSLGYELKMERSLGSTEEALELACPNIQIELLWIIESQAMWLIKFHAKQDSGYYHLIFSKRELTTEFLAYINEADQTSFEQLFRKSFNHEITPLLWQYKYANEAGFSMGMFRRQNKNEAPTLIAHYGGIKRKVLFFGTPQLALQVGDVMVDSSVIQSLKRKGPFFNIASTFLEQHIGFSRDALIGFGFPNMKAMKVASLIGVYVEVDELVQLSWPSKAYSSYLHSCIEINHDNWSNYEHKINRLWLKMSKDLRHSIVGVRSTDYLYRRFFMRPGKRYQILLVQNKWTKIPQALLVFSEDTVHAELIDIVAPLSSISTALSFAKDHAQKSIRQTLVFRITMTFVNLFKSNDSTLQELGIKIPANQWTHGPDISSMKNAWWLTSGDMDFI